MKEMNDKQKPCRNCGYDSGRTTPINNFCYRCGAILEFKLDKLKEGE